MPKLWTETIEAHRREVRDAIIDTTVALVQEQGVLSVTMSQIAEQAGIGRATLYKYFPDVEAILQAWHEGEIARHLDQLSAIRDRHGRAATRLAAPAIRARSASGSVDTSGTGRFSSDRVSHTTRVRGVCAARASRATIAVAAE